MKFLNFTHRHFPESLFLNFIFVNSTSHYLNRRKKERGSFEGLRLGSRPLNGPYLDLVVDPVVE